MMLKELRRRFVGIAMGSLCAVVLVLLVTLNVVNYERSVGSLDSVLELMASSDGQFPGQGREWRAGSGQTGSSDQVTPPDPDGQDSPSGQPGGKAQMSQNGSLSDPEAPYNTRFFTVRFDADGTVSDVGLDYIATVTSDEAQTMAEAALAAGRAYGRSGVYRWHVYQDSDGNSAVVFLYARDVYQNIRELLLASLAVAVVSIAAVFALVLLLSRRAIRPFAENMEKQKRFITDASHELKTPLTIISASADLLELTTGENEWLTSIRNQLRRLTRLVADLVSLSRLDEEKPPLTMVDFPLSDAVIDAASVFAGPAEAAGKRLALEVEQGLRLTGDEGSIRQLTGILLDNAVKYCDSGGEIVLSLRRQKRNPVLSVSNPCASLPDGDMNRLFDRFYRADASRSSETGGYGIGLSIARAIVEAHRGRITAAAQSGVVTFTAVF